MNRKEIQAQITTKVDFSRKGYTVTAYFRGQEVGSTGNFKYRDRAIKDAIEVGTESVLQALAKQAEQEAKNKALELGKLVGEVTTLLNNNWLKEEADLGRAYLLNHSTDTEKLTKLKARCKQLIQERTKHQTTDLGKSDCYGMMSWGNGSYPTTTSIAA